MKFKSNIGVQAGIEDNNDLTGNSGQILSSTGSGVSWIDQGDITIGEAETAKSLQVTVKNVSGGELTKGTVVHTAPTASPPSGNVIEVIAADYDDTTKMPAIGILKETIANEAEGEAVMTGALSGIATDGFSIGDELYVGADGALTNVKPQTAGQLIQKIAVCVKSHASNGLIKIFGAGRSNDVPLPLYIDNANQRLGIGTASPGAKLDVNGRIISRNDVYISSVYPRIWLNDANNNSDYSIINSNGTLQIFDDTNSEDRFAITSEGNVGIGTITPGAPLEVNGVSGAGGVGEGIRVTRQGINGQYISIDEADGSKHRIRAIGNKPFEIFSSADSYGINLSTNSLERMRITSTGNVGIGTTSPGEKLHISDGTLKVQSSGSTRGVRITPNGEIEQVSSSTDWLHLQRNHNGLVAIGNDSTANLYVANNAGIGTTSPDSILDISDTSPILTINASATTSHGIEFKQNNTLDAFIKQTPSSGEFTFNVGRNSSWGGDFRFITDTYDSYRIQKDLHRFYILGSERMRITSSGSVGIGTTSPQYKLDVNGGAGVPLRLNSTADNQLILNSSNSWTGIGFNDGAASGTDYIWHNGQYRTFALGGGGSNVSGKKLHVHGATTIGTGLAPTAAPTNGLLVEGNVGIGTTDPSYRLAVYGASSDSEIVASFGSANDQNEYTAIGLSGYIASNGATKAGLALKRTATYGTGELHFLNNNTLDNSDVTLSDSKMMINSSGNVGIGTTNPIQKLQVTGSAYVNNGTLFLDTNQFLRWGNSNQGIKAVNDGNMSFVTGSNERVTIKSNGNVGIGTTDPGAKLEVSQTTTDLGAIIGNTTHNSQLQIYTAAASKNSEIWFGDAADADVGKIDYDHADNSLAFTTNTSERMRINSDGTVGIGPTALDTAGGDRLHVDGTLRVGPYFSTNDRDFIKLVPNSTDTKIISPNERFHIENTDGDIIITPNTSGGVGIGTTSPDGLLNLKHTSSSSSVANDATAYALTLNFEGATGDYGRHIAIRDASGQAVAAIGGYDEGTGGATGLFFATGNATTAAQEAMMIDANGKVGIGTTSPGNKLHVSGGEIQVVNGSSGKLLLQNSTNYVYGDQNGVGIFNANNNLRLYTVGSERIRITSAGNVGIGVIPKTGGPTWQHIQFGGTGNIIARKSDSTVGSMFSSNYYINSSNVDSHITTGAATRMYLDGGDIRFDTAPSAATDAAAVFSNRLFIANNGNVGIGTTNPGAKLDVEGRVDFSNDLRLRGTDSSANQGVTRFYVDSSNKLFIDTANDGSNLFVINSSGYVGIGTTIPNTPLHINADAPTIRLQDATSGDNHYFTGNNGELRVQTSGYMTMRPGNAVSTTFLANGNVGIGTTIPLQKLHLNDGTNVNLQIGGVSGELQIKTTNDADTAYIPMVLRASEYNILNGNVGIGTTSPSDGDLNINDPKLHVKAVDTSGAFSLAARFQGGGDANNTGTAIAINHSNDRGLLIKAGRKDSDRPVAYFDLIDSNGSTTNMLTMGEYGSDFNVGIGTTSPSVKLEVDVTGNNKVLKLTRDTGTNGVFDIDFQNADTNFNSLYAYTFQTNEVEKMRITSSGNVGIGTTSPSEKLEVDGNILATGTILGSNLSGTNTGDQDLSVYYTKTESDGRFVNVTGDTMTGALSINEGGATIKKTNSLSKQTVLTVQELADEGSQQTLVLKNTNNRDVGIKFETAGGINYIWQDSGDGIDDALIFSTGGENRTNDAALILHQNQEVIIPNGNVGIGTTSPSQKLEVVGNIRAKGDDPKIYVTSTAINGRDYSIQSSQFGTFGIYDGTTSRLSITSNGNVGVGTTSPGYKLDVAGSSRFQNSVYIDTNTGSDALFVTRLGGASESLKIYTTDSASVFETIQDETTTTYGSMMFKLDSGAPDPDFSFWYGEARRLKIEGGTGNVGIGTASPTSPLTIKSNSTSSSSSGLTIQSNGNTNNIFELAEKSTDGARLQMYDAGVAKIALYTDGTDNYINAGNVGIGTTSPGQKLDVAGNIECNSLYLNNASSLYFLPTYFGQRIKANCGGLLVQNGSTYQAVYASAFSVQSDYRLKSNVVPLDNAIDRLKQMSVHRFNWNDRLDEPKVDGFIAHELSEVVPEAVLGEKDAVKEDGTPDYQGIDQSKIVPLLTAALQDAITKIEQLETRIQTLENYD